MFLIWFENYIIVRKTKFQGFDYREVFRKIDDDFRMIMADAQRDNRTVALLRIGSIKSTLATMLDRLERCQKSLNEFLEEKRSSFPRFYFIGDDDLLQILGQATKPAIIQTHLKKLFAGIYNVNFDPTNQVSISEKCDFLQKHPPKQRVKDFSLFIYLHNKFF
jgi:dynein heavy chain 2